MGKVGECYGGLTVCHQRSKYDTTLSTFLTTLPKGRKLGLFEYILYLEPLRIKINIVSKIGNPCTH